MKTKIKNTRMSVVIAVLLLVLSLFGGGRVIPPAFADAGYSSVMTDLQKDSNFSVGDYPAVSDDYSLNVIQIAESTDDELFVYVHNPSALFKPLVATSVNMSFSESATDTHLYELIYVSTYSVFGKYKVKNFSVSAADVRYYNITSIYRPWDKDIDGDSDNDNEKNEKAYPVGKLYKVETVDSNITYSCKAIDVLQIKNPYVDFITYSTAYGWDFIFNATRSTDVHYIAFSTNKKIDQLKQADVTYCTQPYTYKGIDKTFEYGDVSDPQYESLTGDSSGSLPSEFHKKYEWKCIQRTVDFIETVNLNAETKAHVEKCEFVLLFLTTPFTSQTVSTSAGHKTNLRGTKVSDVSILRLEFETAGKTYNLGAISDKVTGDDIAGNQPDTSSKSWSWWKLLLIIVAVTFVIGLIIAAIKWGITAVVYLIFSFIKYLFIGLWSVVSAPFRLIAWIVRKCGGGK